MKIKLSCLPILIFAGILFISSCKKSDDGDSSIFLGNTYFPMQVGDSLIYDAHVHTKDVHEYDSNYQILECVESVFTDIEGRPTFRLERYVRNTPADGWVIFDVWTANVNSVQVEKKEENITYIKLSFPTQLNKKWNGNAKNILDIQDYEVSEIHQPLMQNNLSYDSTLTVTEIFDNNLVEPVYWTSKYAAGVGMIFREKRDYDFQQNSQGQIDTTGYNEYTEILNYHN